MELSEKITTVVVSSEQKRTVRNEAVDSILRSFTSIKGVTAAAIVDSDGLVTSIRREFDVNTDALGASVQIVFGAATRAAEHVSQGNVKIVISENSDGYIMMAPLNQGLMLALFTDEDALLGAVRFEIKETLPALNQLF
jgi:predicted regulator of Ras-like GTPase activity (Roadblock/LC7/MglB family)